MVRSRSQTRPPSYVGKQRSDETPRFREAGFGYRPTLTSNVVTMGLASQCEGRYGSDFPTFCPYTGHHTTRRDQATTLLVMPRLPRCSPAWGRSRNQTGKNSRRRHHAACQRGAMVRSRSQTRPPSYVGKQRSDERPRFREAGFGYRPTLASNVVTTSLASQ